MSSTPRAKPTAKPEGGAKPGAKPKAKKPKGAAPTAPISLGMAMNKPAELTEDAAKSDLEALQKQYGALVVNFNNQQAELAAAQKQIVDLEEQVESLQAAAKSEGAPEPNAVMADRLEKTLGELRAAEALNLTLQKKVNKLQVEHVSEEEVDQLFYALEVKEQQLEQAMADKEGLEQEVLTARQMSARGNVEPKFIEIHHNADMSEDEDDEKPQAAAVS